MLNSDTGRALAYIERTLTSVCLVTVITVNKIGLYANAKMVPVNYI